MKKINRIIPIVIIILLIIGLTSIVLLNYYSVIIIILMALLLYLLRLVPKYEKITNKYKYETFKEKYYQFKEKKVLILFDINEYILLEKLYTKSKRDEIVKEVTDIIVKNTKTDLITRKFNDKFLICIKYQSKEKIEELVTKIHKEVENIKLPESYILSCSFGISYCDKNNLEDEELDCISALKSAKDSYNKFYSFYELEAFDTKINNKKILDELIYSLKNNKLIIYLQPIYDTKTLKINGAEALVRMKKDDQIIPAGNFIDLAEKEGLITLVDRYVFVEVCKIINSFKKEKIPFHKIAVNVSRETIEESLDFYNENFKKYGITRSDIELEITERNSSESEIKDLKKAIKNLEKDFIISLDDFGTGYSTLSMLSEYDIHTLKIDKAFVNSDLEKNKKIISHLVELSKELNIETIAEGVENEEEYNFLKKLGCNNIQGYYLSRPISVEDFKSKILNK